MAKMDPYTREAVGVIRELMERQGMTRTKLAKSLKVSPSYVTQILSDGYDTSCSPETLERFANALGSTLSISVTPLPLTGGGKGSGKLTPKKKGGNKRV